MADVNEVIEWLGCLATNQHKCEGCPYNPHPGMGWIYGCIAGQGKIVDDAQNVALKCTHVRCIDITATVSPGTEITTVRYEIERYADPRITKQKEDDEAT